MILTNDVCLMFFFSCTLYEETANGSMPLKCPLQSGLPDLCNKNSLFWPVKIIQNIPLRVLKYRLMLIVTFDNTLLESRVVSVNITKRDCSPQIENFVIFTLTHTELGTT